MNRALIDASPDALLCRRLVSALGREGAHVAVDALVSKLSNVELSALAARWEFWARPKQMAPPGDWSSWGNLTARGWGKTKTFAGHITGEVQAGRANVVIMAAQNLTKTIAVQVAGLIEAAPPWFRPVWRSSTEELHWPNGAVAFAFTPEVPDAIRSPNAHLCWLSELQSWPASTREEAYSNFQFATRVGYARTLWDATPKRGHAILKRLIANSASDPTNHIITRGTIYENPHISRKALAKMELDYGGTQKGREELLGEMLGDEDAIFKAAWFDLAPRRTPARLKRRIFIVDPAITADARSSDSSGILEMGIDDGDHLYVFANLSGKHRAEDWAAMVIDGYVARRMDLIVIETNRGGDTHVGLLRVIAKSRGLEIVELAKDDVAPVHREGRIYVRAITARRQKSARAEGAAALCERGRVSFVTGLLGDLEEQLAGFDGSENKSDDAVDAFVHGCHELAGLSGAFADPSRGFTGIVEMSRALQTGASRAGGKSISTLLGGRGTGGRI